MSKILAALVVAAFATGVYAQDKKDAKKDAPAAAAAPAKKASAAPAKTEAAPAKKDAAPAKK